MERLPEAAGETPIVARKAYRRFDVAFAFAIVVALFMTGCTGPAVDEPVSAPELEHGPVGRERYEQLLFEGSGSRIGAPRLESWADQAFREISFAMDAVAAGVISEGTPEIGPASSAAASDEIDASAPLWQTRFSQILRDHPPDVASLLEKYRSELERAEEFVRLHDLVTLPPDPIEVVEARNVAIRQSFPLALYLDGQLGLTTSSTADPDPGYLANHCLDCIPPLAVHEGYPGHHVGFWHLSHQSDYPSSEIESRASENDKNMFLLEGWALYGELLMIEQGYYSSSGELLAALRGLLHRALRARIDVQLHTGEIDREGAIDTYVRELLMTREAAETEVRRHLSQPTNKATYFVGLIQILELRRQVFGRPVSGLQVGGDDMSLLEFHDRLLRWSLPFPEIAKLLFEVDLDLTRVGEEGSVIPLEQPVLVALSG